MVNLGVRSFGSTLCTRTKDTYVVWHVEHIPEELSTPPSDDSTSDLIPFPLPHTMVEWRRDRVLN